MAAVMIYVTASGEEEARKIGRALVEQRLAACANVLPGVTSIYRWQGKVEEGGEASLILKTTADKVEAVTARVRELHSYTTPCVVALPIGGGNPAFLDWIETETR
jgi:periplasmic divalent cation tolerance protein